MLSVKYNMLSHLKPDGGGLIFGEFLCIISNIRI